MDNKTLNNLLAKLTHIEAEVRGMMYIITNLEEECERKFKQEEYYLLLLLDKWINGLNKDLLESMGVLDEYIIRN